MSNWDKEVMDTEEKKYVKLNDGEEVVGVLSGEPKLEYVVWVNDKGKKTKTVVPEGTKDSKFRFLVNLAVKGKDGKWEAKVLEQGKSVFNAIKKLRNVGYNLNDTFIALSRSGTGLETEYSLVTLPTKLSDEDKAQLATLELNEL